MQNGKEREYLEGEVWEVNGWSCWEWMRKSIEIGGRVRKEWEWEKIGDRRESS